MKRVFLFVLDSFGIGNAPDSRDFGDFGANTALSVSKSEKFKIDNMASLGFFNIDGVEGKKHPTPLGCFGRLTEASRGKDTIIGHWELGGIISKEPLPVYPDGFPSDVIDEFSKKTGRGVLCNKPYSGTKVIADYGEEHIKTGNLIVYTSADSVFQVAAHEDVVPVKKLYEYCEIARKMLNVGRVIARPFEGKYPFTRTSRRHDFALLPPKDTLLDLLHKHNLETVCIGKISDIFADRGVSEKITTSGNNDGMDKAMAALKRDFCGLCFVNLVDFDMVYGHRRDVDGYAAAISEFDRRLHDFMSQMKDDDLLIVTADHGCDPNYSGTDHTRECVPLLLYSKNIKSGVNLSTLSTFADVGSTIADIFGIHNTLDGVSFWQKIKK